MFKLVHAGFDTLDVAFQGALSIESLKCLQAARDEAADTQEDLLINLGPGNVAMHVAGHGTRGGYAYLADTGPLGCKWLFKNNADPTQWNIFASPRATALLAFGFQGIQDHLQDTLRKMGVRLMDHSVNRVDFAMDFQTRGFELALDQFVAHPRAKAKSHWGDAKSTRVDRNRPVAVARGRRLESVTIGKMPGRQMIVYDKRREAIDSKKFFWFDTWDIDRTDTKVEIWRVEIRAGKKELKGRWNIRRCEDVETSIGDVYNQALREVRYVDDLQSDSNVTRQRPHALWLAAHTACTRHLADFRSGLVPGQIVEIERQIAMDRYASLIVGNAIGYGIAHGMCDDELISDLPTLIAKRVRHEIECDRKRFTRTVNRARERLHFLSDHRWGSSRYNSNN